MYVYFQLEKLIKKGIHSKVGKMILTNEDAMPILFMCESDATIEHIFLCYERAV